MTEYKAAHHSERTLDDGNGSVYCLPGYEHYCNMPALHHDPNMRGKPDVPTDGNPVPNKNGKSPVAF